MRQPPETEEAVLPCFGGLNAAAGLASKGHGTDFAACDTTVAGGAFGAAFAVPSVGYSVVYHVEMLLLFVTLIAVGPLVRHGVRSTNNVRIAPVIQ